MTGRKCQRRRRAIKWQEYQRILENVFPLFACFLGAAGTARLSRVSRSFYQITKFMLQKCKHEVSAYRIPTEMEHCRTVIRHASQEASSQMVLQSAIYCSVFTNCNHMVFLEITAEYEWSRTDIVTCTVKYNTYQKNFISSHVSYYCVSPMGIFKLENRHLRKIIKEILL